MLDDVHRQINSRGRTKNVKGNSSFRRIDGTTQISDDEYELGVVKGYAVQHPSPSGFVLPQNHANDFDFESYKHAIAGNKAGSCP